MKLPTCRICVWAVMNSFKRAKYVFDWENIWNKLEFNSCVFLPFKRLEAVFRDFELIKISRKFFSSEVWPEVSRKSEDFSERLWIYESGQHPHAISLGYLLVVHSKKGACLLKGKKKDAELWCFKKKTQLLKSRFISQKFRKKFSLRI